MNNISKKLATFLAVTALFTCCAMPLSRTEAAEAASITAAAPLFTVQSYWNGDTNYPLAFSQGTANRYVDLSSAKLEEKTSDETAGVLTAVFSYKVVMVNNNEVTNTFDYKTMIKIDGENVVVAAQRANDDSWSPITDSSFNQPQYNATLILADYFGV